ncbi:hypothetical protein U9M48_003979 [Paspalum notatum var. saurae]|uniref:Uncharacterized protein n=1 Tax=Paspalum notatum var. saurae TaxID=547442 RepID=A0AAQ3PUN0_PASNO
MKRQREAEYAARGSAVGRPLEARRPDAEAAQAWSGRTLRTSTGTSSGHWRLACTTSVPLHLECMRAGKEVKGSASKDGRLHL